MLDRIQKTVSNRLCFKEFGVSRRNYTSVMIPRETFHSTHASKIIRIIENNRKFRSKKNYLKDPQPRRIYESTLTRKTLIRPHSSLMHAIKLQHVCLIVTSLIRGNVTKLSTFIFVIIRLSVFILCRKYRCPG